MLTPTIAANSYYLLLLLAFVLSIVNISSENKTNKALSIYNLVVYILGFILIIFYKTKNNDLNKKLLGTSVIVITSLTLALSIENISDENQDDKILPIIVLILSLFFIGVLFLYIPGHHGKLMFGTA